MSVFSPELSALVMDQIIDDTSTIHPQIFDDPSCYQGPLLLLADEGSDPTQSNPD